MKPLRLSGIFLFLFSYCATANTFQLKSKELASPIYKHITDLVLRATNKNISFINVEFLDQTGAVGKEKISRRFTGTEFNDCTSFPCHLNVVRLPFSLEKPACFLRISTNEGTISNIAWGNCEKLPARPNENFLPDLAFSDDPTNSAVSIQNEGYPLVAKTINVTSYLEDRSGNVIWSDQNEHVVTLSEAENASLPFKVSLKGWQQHLGCSLKVSLDSNYDLHEKKKRNNELSLMFGLCEATPDMENGDLFDFEPIIDIDSSEVHFRVSNNGRLPLIKDNDILQEEIIISFSDGSKKIHSLERRGPLYGFGDTQTIFTMPLTSDVCGLSMNLNPNRILKESNTQNNFKSSNLCN